MKTIYELELHEEILPNNNLMIKRVAGGWIYFHEVGSVFVPFSPEYQFKDLKRKINPDVLRSCIASFYGLPDDFTQSYSRIGNYPLGRKVMAYTLKKYTTMSLYEIRDAIGYKQHASVIAACNSFQNDLDTDNVRVGDYNEILKAMNLR